MFPVGCLALIASLLCLGDHNGAITAILLACVPLHLWLMWKIVNMLWLSRGVVLRVDGKGILRKGVTRSVVPWHVLTGEPLIISVGAVRTIIIPVDADHPEGQPTTWLEAKLRPAEIGLLGTTVINLGTGTLDADVDALFAQLLAWQQQENSVF